MKTQLSRKTFDASKRYSGVYQQMGRMLTDADWNELSDLNKDRLADVLSDIVGKGTPKDRGIMEITDNGDGSFSYQLLWGYAYVDGIVCQVRPDPDAVLDDPAGLAFEYLHQADFPNAEPTPDGDYLVYLDVWDRTITTLEDSDLIDAGLHGADTCTRTQTMTQVKWCLPDIDPEDPAQNPEIGGSLLSLQLRQSSTETDLCDPCADEISLQDNVGNYLFRVEIHHVVYDASGDAQRVFIKWSSENGAEQYSLTDQPAGFVSSTWAYEFFNGAAEQFASEKHLGMHHSTGFTPARGELSDQYSEPAGFSLVRRWDGYCELENNAGTWTLLTGFDRGTELSDSSNIDAPGHFENGSTISINLESIILTLDLSAHQLVAGDFWQAPVRQATDVAGTEILPSQTPQGIHHHYMTLGSVIDEQFIAYQGDQCKRFEFPALTDITVADVCYLMPGCGDEQQATIRSLLENKLDDDFPDSGEQAPLKILLDALMCEHAATTLPLIKDEQLCPPLQAPEIVSVQDALNELCRREVDGCATYTVFPRPGWESVFTLIADREDAHICFREGSYSLADTVLVSNKGHLSISGAGSGTHIFANHESVLQFENCSSVTVEKMYVEGRSANTASQHIQHLNGALTFSDCGDVNVSHTTLRCAAGIRPAATCLTVNYTRSGSGTANIINNKIEVGHQQIAMLILNQTRSYIANNHIKTRAKPRSITLERQLTDRRVAAKARKLLVNNGEVRNFDSARARGKKNIQLSSANNQRRVLIESPVAASIWRDNIISTIGDRPLRSNQELLAVTKGIASRVITDVGFRNSNINFVNWFELLRQQNPAVSFKGIVCGGRVANEVRIINNTVEGAQEAIHVGLSDRDQTTQRSYTAGRVIIENNTLNVRIPPLVIHRRGGIFVGNCNHLTISQNQITVQKYLFSRQTAVEAIRIHGRLGRMVVIDQNYSTNCTTGIRFVPLDVVSKQTKQWLIADNLMAGVGLVISSSQLSLLTLRNNIK